MARSEKEKKKKLIARAHHFLRRKKLEKNKKAAGPDPAAAGAAGASGGGAAPVAPPVARDGGGGKKALIGSALRELTSVLATPAGGVPAGGKINGALSNILSIALDNRNFLGLNEGVFDFGKEFCV